MQLTSIYVLSTPQRLNHIVSLLRIQLKSQDSRGTKLCIWKALNLQVLLFSFRHVIKLLTTW